MFLIRSGLRTSRFVIFALGGALGLAACISPTPPAGSPLQHMQLVPGTTNANGSVNVQIKVTGMTGATVSLAIDDPFATPLVDGAAPYNFVVPAGPHHLYGQANNAANVAVLDEWSFPPPASPCARKGFGQISGYNHVVVIVMENKPYNAVIGDPAAPYLTNLAQQCGTATSWSQSSSPSRPNYIDMTSGSVQGCAGSNADPPSCQTTSDNIFRQVIGSGGTAKSYIEGMTSNCQYASGGVYATKHNPWPYYVGPNDQAYCQQFDIPLGTSTAGALINDINAGALPTLSYIVPDLCNDTHDCPVATGDAWLQTVVSKILNGANYAAGDTAVVITYDEYTPVPNVWIAPSVQPGTVYTGPMSHQGLLRTIEEWLRLPLLNGAATAPSMRNAMNI